MRSASSSSPAPDIWWPYFSAQCAARGVRPEILLGGSLARWLPPNVRQTPPLRVRERAWLQLFASSADTDRPAPGGGDPPGSRPAPRSTAGPPA
jgi:hypothetical protein